MSKITTYKGLEPIYNKEKAWAYINEIETFLKEKAQQANASGFIVGISGGIDSSLVFSLAKRVFPNNTLGIVMPVKQMTASDLSDIAELEKAQNAKFQTVDLTQTFQALQQQLLLNNHLALSNIKPRLRMTTLYALAQENNSLVLGTDNADEVYVGYFTKFGDGGADLLPISKLTKGEVRFLASLVGVPECILNKAPSAGLWEGQTDESELGFSYAQLDFFLNHLDNFELIKQNLEPQVIDKIQTLHYKTEHKRHLPPTPSDVQ